MSSKNYTLVAWTENGNLRMVPSLVNVAAEPYKGSDLEDHYLFFSLDDQITDREFSESYASMRAWRFGKA